MDDTVAVPLKGVAIGMRRLRIAASAGIFYADGVRGEHKRSVAGQTLEEVTESRLRYGVKIART